MWRLRESARVQCTHDFKWLSITPCMCVHGCACKLVCVGVCVCVCARVCVCRVHMLVHMFTASTHPPMHITPRTKCTPVRCGLCTHGEVSPHWGGHGTLLTNAPHALLGLAPGPSSAEGQERECAPHSRHSQQWLQCATSCMPGRWHHLHSLTSWGLKTLIATYFGEFFSCCSAEEWRRGELVGRGVLARNSPSWCTWHAWPWASTRKLWACPDLADPSS